MTNGELIQKVFNCEVCGAIPEDDIIHVIFPDKNDSAIGFDYSWWNMEYKDSTTKNCESCKYYGSHHEVCNYCYKCSLWTEKEPITKNDVADNNVGKIEPTTKNCRTCRNFGSHHGICEICKDNKCWTEKEPTKNDLAVDCISRK